MPLRMLMRIIEQNPHLIQKLSDSYPIRQAAKTAVYFMNKTKDVVEDKLDEMDEKVKKTNSPNGSKGFMDKFTHELKQGFSELREEVKDDSNKKK